MLITQYSNFNKNLRYIVVKLKKNNYQDLPWNNTIEEIYLPLPRPLCWWERDQCLAHCQGLHPNTLFMAL
jgi:hypothetical protein